MLNINQLLLRKPTIINHQSIQPNLYYIKHQLHQLRFNIIYIVTYLAAPSHYLLIPISTLFPLSFPIPYHLSYITKYLPYNPSHPNSPHPSTPTLFLFSPHSPPLLLHLHYLPSIPTHATPHTTQPTLYMHTTPTLARPINSTYNTTHTPQHQLYPLTSYTQQHYTHTSTPAYLSHLHKQLLNKQKPYEHTKQQHTKPQIRCRIAVT